MAMSLGGFMTVQSKILNTTPKPLVYYQGVSKYRGRDCYM